MRAQRGALEAEGQRLLAARKAYATPFPEVTSYSALRPEDYLNGFEPDAAAKQRDVAEPHPWRRYFARGIDLRSWGFRSPLCSMCCCTATTQPFPVGEDIVCALIGWGLLLLLEPLLLARFGTTAGKWCMGIIRDAAGRANDSAAAKR